MNKRTIILITICCLLAVATVTMRYIEQEIEIIRSKFIGDKRTEERTPRGRGSARPAPTRTPQGESAPAAVKQNAIRPSGPGMGQSPPAAAAASSAAKTVITTTAVVPGKKTPMADAVPDTNRTAAVEDVTTPLESEPSAVANDEAPVSERAETTGIPDAAASNAEDKKVPAADAPPGADSGTAAAVELAGADEAAAAGDRGGMKEAAVEGKSDESQGEEAIGEDEPAPVEENEEGDQVAADEEPSPGAADPAAEPTKEVVDEE